MGVRVRIGVAIAALLVGVVAVVVVLGSDGGPRVGARIGLPDEPHAVSAGDGGVFVADGAGRVSRIDPGTGRVRELGAGAPDPTDMVNAFGSVWIAGNATGSLVRIDPRTGRTRQRIVVGRHPLSLFSGLTGVAAGDGRVVTSAGDGVVARVEPDGGSQLSAALYRRTPRPSLSDVAVGDGSVWASDGAHDRLFELDGRSLRPRGEVRVGRRPVAVASGAGAVWVANEVNGTVSRVDFAEPRDRVRSLRVGGEPTDIAVGAGSVWVAEARHDAVLRIDPRTDRVEDRIPVGVGLRQLAVGDRAIWAIRGFAGIDELVRIDP